MAPQDKRAWWQKLTQGPQGGPQGLAGLASNPLFNMGMGLLAHRADARVNPWQAVQQGLMTAQASRTAFDETKYKREEREYVKKEREAEKRYSADVSAAIKRLDAPSDLKDVWSRLAEREPVKAATLMSTYLEEQAAGGGLDWAKMPYQYLTPESKAKLFELQQQGITDPNKLRSVLDFTLPVGLETIGGAQQVFPQRMGAAQFSGGGAQVSRPLLGTQAPAQGEGLMARQPSPPGLMAPRGPQEIIPGASVPPVAPQSLMRARQFGMPVSSSEAEEAAARRRKEAEAVGIATGQSTGMLLKDQAQARIDLPRAELAAQNIFDSINRIRNFDPKVLANVLGPIESRVLSLRPGSIELEAMMDQFRGQAFLNQYQLLKGGGPITDIEGQAATAAAARLDQAQSPKAYLAAMDDAYKLFEDELNIMRNRAQGKYLDTGTLSTGQVGFDFGID